MSVDLERLEWFLEDGVPVCRRPSGEIVAVSGGGGGVPPDLLARLESVEGWRANTDIVLDEQATAIAALQAGGGSGGIEEWLDVTRHFHLEYRSSPGVDVQRGRASEAYPPGPVFSIGYFRTRTAFWIDAYVRFGDGCTAYKESLSEGERRNGWDLVCYDPTLYPLGATGGFGICQIHSADPHEGENTTGKAHWEPKSDGKWAIIPNTTPLGISGGNFSWLYPEVSGHAIWEFAGSFFRIIMGPCRRRI